MASLASSRNTGKANLEKARFFLDRLAQVEVVEPFDRAAAEALLDAAIVFGKATQDWMADQFGGVTRAEKEAWLRSSSLWNDPIAKRFADTRDVIVHDDGTVELDIRVSVTVHATAGLVAVFGGSAVATVTPANATPEQLEEIRLEHERERAEATRRAAEERREKHERLQAEHRARAAERAKQHPDVRKTRTHFASTDVEFSDRPAIEVVVGYLDHLELVLDGQQASGT